MKTELENKKQGPDGNTIEMDESKIATTNRIDNADININGNVIGFISNNPLSACNIIPSSAWGSVGVSASRDEVRILKEEVKQLRKEVEHLKRLIIAQQTLFISGDDGAL